ncbi:MAG: peptidoglycan DD-metalloendopeptidase family protein [Rhodomicrobiaceae bacterium]
MLQPASYGGGSAGSSIERTSLAPVRTASSEGGNAGTYMGGSYAMQPLDADAGGQPERGAVGKRYAQASSGYYDRRASDYQPSYSDYKPYRKPHRRPERTYDTPRYGGTPKYDSAPKYDAPKYERSADDYDGDSYLVVQGDTLYGIARRFGMTTGELAGLNGITGSTIYAGQRLQVRGAPKYTATSRYDRKLPRYEKDAPSRHDNGYAEDERKAPPHYSGPGRDDAYEDAESDRYDAPARRAPKRHAKRYDAPPREYGPEASRYRKPKGSYDSYQVRRGDTLYEIARSYGLSHHELARYNDIPPSATLYPGQRLHIPKGYSYNPGPETEDAPGDAYSRRDRRDYEPPAEGYSRRRVPYSQNSDDAEDKRKPARRVARVEPADGGDGRVINDASPRQAEPASAPSRASQPQPILAAHRDVDPQRPDAASAGRSSNCESLLANPIARSAQTFRQPVQGLMVAKFGSNKDGSFNDGVDFSVPKGTPVKAAENGVVAYVGNELSGFGNLVLVRHADGYVTAYAHNDEVLVSRCDVVKRGQIIAKAGATGKVTQPQLHFELRKDSKAIDPVSHFSRS